MNLVIETKIMQQLQLQLFYNWERISMCCRLPYEAESVIIQQNLS